MSFMIQIFIIIILLGMNQFTKLYKEDYILYLKPNIYYDATNLIIRAVFQIKIPTTIDLARNEIVYIYKDVYEFNIDQFGNCSEQLHTNFDLNKELTNKEIMYYDYVSPRRVN